ncbi:PAS domain S-box protein [Marinobacter sp.]|uniref:PAS domain S-box protein n=1 Tax=Marinobacter sp. TaxID=50741 RepID=UPI002B273E3B|nr:PAS domain S-box protein [Marinobacter sp.]
MSFRWKTILGIALIELFFLVILVWQASQFIQSVGETDIQKRADDTTFLAGSVILDSLISYDLASLEEHVLQIGTLDGVRYVKVEGYGKTLADVSLSADGTVISDTGLSAVEDGIHHVQHELKAGGETFGVLSIGFSLEELYALASEAKSRLFFIAVPQALLVALAAWFLGHYLTKRLLVLRDASVKLQAGELTEPVVVRGKDEVSETMHAFNNMSKVLLDREQALNRLNDELVNKNEQLIQRDDDVQALLAGAPDGIATIDENNCVVYANKVLGELLEIEEQTLVGQPISEFLGEDAVLALDSGPTKNEGPARRTITELSSFAGRRLSLEISVSSFRTGSSGLSILIIRDRTREHELAHAAQVSDKLRANLIETSLDALITINQDGLVTDFSQSAEELFGWSKQEIIGKPMADHVIPEESRPAHYKGMQHYLATGEGPILGMRIETRAQRRGGQSFPIEMVLTPTKIDDEIFVTAAIRDITERKNREEELIEAKAQAEEASTAKSRFLSYMSHEIRSPLNAVLGSLALIQDQAGLGEAGTRYVHLARQSGDALLQVVNEVLDFSKIEAGHIAFEKVTFPVEDLLGGVTASIKAKGIKGQVNIRTEVSAELPEQVEADRDHLRQVLTILMDNAYKFTEAGEVAVHVSSVAATDSESDENRMRIEVRDTGPGIPADLAENVFSEFEQVDAMRDTGYGGTGLGLAIARKLVEGMDGTIWLESSVGIGTTFFVEIPYSEANEEEADLTNTATSEHTPASTNLDDSSSPRVSEGSTILLVDDVYANLIIGAELLKSKGYRVDIACDGVEAVELASEKVYSVILMDMRMPRLNGLEATEQIRSTGGLNARTPIIALSANAEKSEIERCYKVGMNDFVSKPFKIEQLTAVIESCPQESGSGDDPMIDMETKYAEFEVMSAGVLKQLARDTSEAAVPMMLTVFINEIKKRAQGIAQAHNSKDEGEIREQAHAMKSCAGTFGGLRLQAAAKDLEDVAGESKACENPALIRQVGKVADDTLMAYSEYHKRLESEFT